MSMDMTKRTIYIQNPAKVSVAHKSLKVCQRENIEVHIPLEDIYVVVIESLNVNITSYALSALLEAGIGTMICGSTHMPLGLLLPIGAHSRHSGIVKQQLLMKKPLKKQLWQKIIERKILNQAEVLSLLNINSTELVEDAKQVLSGDSTNRESVAASRYFKLLLPNGGRRGSQFTPALDYGYALLRAAIAREAVSAGWLVSQGIHHSNNLNAFNLIDDLIEPFRPVVDLLVINKSINHLNPENKRTLVSVFEFGMRINGKEENLQNTIKIVLDSLKRAINKNDSSLLLLPHIIPLNVWKSE